MRDSLSAEACRVVPILTWLELESDATATLEGRKRGLERREVKNRKTNCGRTNCRAEIVPDGLLTKNDGQSELLHRSVGVRVRGSKHHGSPIMILPEKYLRLGALQRPSWQVLSTRRGS